MNNLCVKCGALASHHHKYCDLHYPQKSATILQLKNSLKKVNRELERFKKRHLELKSKYKKLKKQVKMIDNFTKKENLTKKPSKDK
jgi:Skp family chaperone for outer membrane proteins